MEKLNYTTGSIRDRISGQSSHVYEQELKQLLERVIDMVNIAELHGSVAKLKEADCIDDVTERLITQKIAQIQSSTKAKARDATRATGSRKTAK